MTVSALIPAFNEADRIGDALRAVTAFPRVDEVICIDDGSTDGTAQAAAQVPGVRVIRLETNRGKGAALNRGLAEARGEVILLLDADLGATASAAEPLLAPVLEGTADMTIAVLPPARRGGAGLVVRCARFLVLLKTGRWFPAPLSGQRAIRRELLDEIAALRGQAFADRYGVETALNIDACLAEARILEVALPLDHREHGKSVAGWKHRGRQLVDLCVAVRQRL